jgi:glycosyltransferase involved in cell wall biosynthesis
MKILLNCPIPFPFAHGGQQIQIEQTKNALEKIGVETEFLRWWDEKQTGDILHQIGQMTPPMVRLAQKNGWRVANTFLLTGQCNRSEKELLLRRMLIRPLMAAPLPRNLKELLPWQVFRTCDRVIVGLEAERMVMEKVYGVRHERISLVPLGLAESYLKAGPAERSENHLICSGTIGPLKSSVEIARLAVAAKTPVLFVGKPFDFKSDYWREFEKLIDGKIVKHHPHVASEGELISLLKKSRGYVLLSRYENWSLAAHEAAACGLPMLVQDQRWSRERFGDKVQFWPSSGSEDRARALREFYDRCPSMTAPQIHLHSWIEAAGALRDVYKDMLAKPRGQIG